MNQEIAERIHAADLAIREERFDDLMQFYCEDAVLVIRPGKTAIGKAAIREAFVKIAAYFQNSIVPTQGRMEMLEAGDTVLVLSGVTGRHDISKFPYRPRLVLNGVGDIPGPVGA